jgi:acetyl esterase/lipase
MSTPLKTVLVLLCAVLVLGVFAACSPLQTINALTPSSTYTRTTDLAYGTDPRDRVDVYAPSNLAPGATAPVVVFFYGGNWNSGSRGEYKFVGEALASRGMVAVIADYRLYPQVRYPAFLEDSAAAVAWTVQHIGSYGGDTKRLFVMGHSAGGYNAAMMALDARWLRAANLSPAIFRGWIGLAGPYDFIPITNEDARPVFFYPNTPVASQPINHVTAVAPPALLVASRSDRLVNPVRNTGGLAAKLRAAGVPVEEIYTEHTSHASLVGSLALPLRGLAPTLDLIEQFVKSDGGRTAGATGVAATVAAPVPVKSGS